MHTLRELLLVAPPKSPKERLARTAGKACSLHVAMALSGLRLDPAERNLQAPNACAAGSTP